MQDSGGAGAHSLGGESAGPGLEKQESSLERWPLWAGPPCPGSAVTKPPNPGEDKAGREGGPLPQLASSLLSWQSLSPSQMKAGFVQMPVEHWNCPGRHLNSAAGRGGSASAGPGGGPLGASGVGRP